MSFARVLLIDATCDHTLPSEMLEVDDADSELHSHDNGKVYHS